MTVTGAVGLLMLAAPLVVVFALAALLVGLRRFAWTVVVAAGVFGWAYVTIEFVRSWAAPAAEAGETESVECVRMTDGLRCLEGGDWVHYSTGPGE